MKEIALTILCSLMIFLANAQETKTYYDNGQLYEVGSFDKNGDKTGEWKKYYYTGKIESVKFYKNGNKEGESKSYYDNEILSRIEFYNYGRREGESKSYHDNGKIESVKFYKKNKRE